MGMAVQISKEGDQQECVVDQDSLNFYFNCFFIHIAITPVIAIIIIIGFITYYHFWCCGCHDDDDY